MEVPVAGVEHVRDRDRLAMVHRVDAGEDLDELRARHDAIVEVVVRRDLGDRTERRLPPTGSAVPRASCLPDRPRRGPRGGSDLPLLRIHPARMPSTSTSSTAAASVGYPAWANDSTARTILIHHLQGRGHHAARDDVGDRRAALHRGEPYIVIAGGSGV